MPPPFVSTTNNSRRFHDASYAATIPRNTPLATVQPLSTPAASLVTYSGIALQANDRASPESPTAFSGMVYLVASSLPAHEANTGVLFAGPSRTTLNNAQMSHNLFIINTPLIPDQWLLMLTNTNLLNQFHNVPTGLRFGFDMGVSSLHTPHLITTPLCLIHQMFYCTSTTNFFNADIPAPFPVPG